MMLRISMHWLLNEGLPSLGRYLSSRIDFTRNWGMFVHRSLDWECGYCGVQPESMSPRVSDAAFISPTRSAGGLPAACICRPLLAAIVWR